MKPYKGIIRISCCDKTCHGKLIQPEAGCLNCVHGTVEILDLEGKVLETLKREMPFSRRSQGYYGEVGKVPKMPKMPKAKNKSTGSQF